MTGVLGGHVEKWDVCICGGDGPGVEKVPTGVVGHEEAGCGHMGATTGEDEKQVSKVTQQETRHRDSILKKCKRSNVVPITGPWSINPNWV